MERGPLKINDFIYHEYITACIENKKLDLALQFVELLTSFEEYQIDVRSLNELGIQLAKEGQHANCIKLFESVDKNKFSHRGKRVIRIPNYYAEIGDTENYQKILEVLRRKELITAADTGLWDIEKTLTLNSSNSNLKEVVEQLETIVDEKKDLPPMSQCSNLLKELIKEEDTDGIRRTIDAFSKVHDESRAYLDLAFAFIETNKLAQAKKIFSTPGLRYLDDKFNYYMKVWMRAKKIDELQNLVKFSLPLFGCDRDHLYSVLISECIHQDKVEKIEDIWIDMQEEGFVPQEEIKTKMAKALSSKGMNVPFEAPIVKKEKVERTKAETDNNNAASNSKTQKDKSQKTDVDKNKEEAIQTLDKVIEKGDANEILNCYKDLFEKGNVGKGAFGLRKRLVDFLRSIKDDDQKIQSIQTLLNDKCFISFVKDTRFMPLIPQLTRAQLESIINYNSSPENSELYTRIQMRNNNLYANEDPEGFMNSLESSTDLNSSLLSTGLLKTLIQANTKNMERLLTISENLLETQPKFAFVTFRASLEANQPEEVASRLWKMLKEGELLSKDHLDNILQASNIPQNIKEAIEKKLKKNKHLSN